MADGVPTDWSDMSVERVDSDQVLKRWVLPGAAALGAMAVGFTLVGIVLLAWETVILGALWRQLLALGVMFLIPHIVAGYVIGRRQGLAVEPPIAAGLAPVLLLVVMLWLFGGPAFTPVRVPLVTVGAIAVWGIAFAGGMAAGAKFTQAQRVS